MNKILRVLIIAACLTVAVFSAYAADHQSAAHQLPLPVETFNDGHLTRLPAILKARIIAEPFNLAATAIFIIAILHSLCCPRILRLAAATQYRYKDRLTRQHIERAHYRGEPQQDVSSLALFLQFFGDVEVVFGFWGIALLACIAYFFNWQTVTAYFNSVDFTEPMFIVVIMTLSASRPIVKSAEKAVRAIARLGGGSAAAWWLTILTIGPLLGSFITEPGAMTISALLLAKQFYSRKPSVMLCYCTIGLLFVNISVGGTLTEFAAPPVLMVADRWQWDMMFMFSTFGVKAVIGIVIANCIYFIYFRKELKRLTFIHPPETTGLIAWEERPDPVPIWICAVHIAFMAWTVINAHYPVFFIGGFLFFLGFTNVTVRHQNRINLKPALLVGFFLAGLVLHGRLQGWWLVPVLSNLEEVPLMIGATLLTTFNDNAAITYLGTLVPDFSDALKYAVMAGAVTGGGMTIIANAPNPVGQSILKKFFTHGVSPLGLAAAALMPTIIMGLTFMLLR